MGMQVNTNIAANNAYRNLATTQNDLSKSLEKLSSGLRINRAADDAAGLTISEGLKSQVGGLTVASRNAQDAISVIQTAEGSLNEVQSILQRVRDLAVQAGNDSNNIASRTAITTEVGQLTKELDRIGQSTNFNGTDLLNGTANLSFQVGASNEASNQIKVDLTETSIVDLASALTSGTAGIKMAVGTFAPSTDPFLSFTNGGIDVTTKVKPPVGTTAQGVADLLNDDADFKGGSMVASADSAGNLIVRSTNGGKIGAEAAAQGGVGVSSTASATGLNFMTAEGAATAINIIDGKLTDVSTARADLGAVQNRFESVIKNLAVSKENLTAAGSRIRDTDMAEEMVKYTRANILSQAGTAMLAQANQSNSGVLQLLQ
jgi:flagellin